MELPNIYTFGLSYEYALNENGGENVVTKEELQKIFDIIPHKIELKDFL